MSPAHVLFLFIDGIGLGTADPAHNPLASPRRGFLRLSNGVSWTKPLPSSSGKDRQFLSLDATLGVDGLPQSGTGQVALFTGVNAPQLAGRHFGPYPHSATREALAKDSIFQHVATAFGTDAVCFANAYPPRFFEFLDRFERWPVTTRACLDAGVRIRTLSDLSSGNAVAADVTGEGLRDLMGDAVSVRSPAATARVLLDLSTRHRLTVFEAFHTDKAGHARDADRAALILDDLSEMTWTLLEHAPPNLLLLMASDHGNLEDLSTKTHTRNLVPFAAVGPGADQFSGIESLTGVAPAVLRALGIEA